MLLHSRLIEAVQRLHLDIYRFHISAGSPYSISLVSNIFSDLSDAQRQCLVRQQLANTLSPQELCHVKSIFAYTRHEEFR